MWVMCTDLVLGSCPVFGRADDHVDVGPLGGLVHMLADGDDGSDALPSALHPEGGQHAMDHLHVALQLHGAHHHHHHRAAAVGERRPAGGGLGRRLTETGLKFAHNHFRDVAVSDRAAPPSFFLVSTKRILAVFFGPLRQDKQRGISPPNISTVDRS